MHPPHLLLLILLLILIARVNGGADSSSSGLFWPQTNTDETQMGGGRVRSFHMDSGRPVLRSSRSEGGHMKPRPGVSFMCRPESMWTNGGSRT